MAEQQLQAGLQLVRQQPDVVLKAQLLAELGIVYNCMGDFEQGKRFLLEALTLAQVDIEAVGDSLLYVLEELGILALIANDNRQATACYEEGLALAETRGNGAQTVMFLKSLGALAHLEGEAVQARGLFERGFRLAQELQFHKGLMVLGNNLGVVSFGVGEMVAAERMLQTAFEAAVRLDDENGRVLIGLNLAYWARFNGRFSQARHAFNDVLALVKVQAHTDLIEMVQAQLAILLAMDGEGGERPLSPAPEHLKVFI